ncbi:MAG: hypothetical protein AVDCRST_MAG91-984 [uncultured Sphingomonadaceae bacterium]|uniref:VOC domain-containing protein n=1 Tax=uncultured Sphingomonadaceae bacterium TaxID=169976 RepID=A0A6J4SNW5_9SPHN|nr:MAG: hypothetical protein AVDCRST_MAG91-984 [uncultured Sphingomonadaceae bacterium]
MLFHLSIEADEPFRVATVLAELWGGVAMPFPPVAEGSWVAFSGDDDGSIIEVYPRGTELKEGAEGAVGFAGNPRRYNATHFAMSTNLDEQTVLSIARHEGWKAERCSRGGKFSLIEIWVEGCQMIEVLTPEMQREYLDAVTIGNWQRMLMASAPMKKAA